MASALILALAALSGTVVALRRRALRLAAEKELRRLRRPDAPEPSAVRPLALGEYVVDWQHEPWGLRVEPPVEESGDDGQA